MGKIIRGKQSHPKAIGPTHHHYRTPAVLQKAKIIIREILTAFVQGGCILFSLKYQMPEIILQRRFRNGESTDDPLPMLRRRQ
jgi:hypothetical protein